MKLTKTMLAAALALTMTVAGCHEPGHELCEENEAVCWLLLGAAVKGAILVAASQGDGLSEET